MDLRVLGKKMFNKEEYEEVSEYFIRELDFRENRMGNLLSDIEKLNIEHQIKIENDNKLGIYGVQEQQKAA